jgi:hypothetical protein
MITKTSRYNACPSCKAMNMAYRTQCYKCSRPISPTVFTVEPIAPKVVLEERRRSKRFEIYGPGWVVDQLGERKFAVIVRNISALGLGFDADVCFNTGESIAVTFSIDGEQYAASGLIRHCARLITSNEGYGTGFEFVNPTKKLMAYINSLDPGTDSWDMPNDF